MTTETNATGRADGIDQVTLKDILGIPDAAMDQAMGIAYQLYQTGRFSDAETVCKGLIACDQRYWWPHSLHASVLRRLGRFEEALAAVEQGLRYEPRQPKLSLFRTELLITIARRRPAASHSATALPSSSSNIAQGDSHVKPSAV